MIIEYNEKYDEDIKNLLVELQKHIENIDKEKYNVLTTKYKEESFKESMKEVKKYNGKILLYEEKNQILGMIIGLVNNEEIDSYDFKAPKRGRITELIISNKIRSKGIGTILLKEMEKHLKNIGCKAILIEVFAYNDKAINFYQKNNYHTRNTEMIKEL